MHCINVFILQAVVSFDLRCEVQMVGMVIQCIYNSRKHAYKNNVYIVHIIYTSPKVMRY